VCLCRTASLFSHAYNQKGSNNWAAGSFDCPFVEISKVLDAFKDGIHLNGLFSSMQVVGMRATASDFSRKDMIGGKEMQFLALSFAEKQGIEAHESGLGPGRCFRMLFGKGCKGCI
jgi:hypothetical protein